MLTLSHTSGEKGNVAGLHIPMWTSPLAMACDLDPQVRRTPALDLLDAKLVELSRTPNGRLLLSFAPQQGKSWLVGRWFLIWSMWLNRQKRCVYASYGLDLARRNQGETRGVVSQHAEQLGMSLDRSFGAKQEWKISEGGGVVAAGVGSALTGKPADLMVIDDPYAGPAEAASPVMRENVKTWWQGVASARLAPGAPLVVLHTRWHEDDLIGWLNKTQGWEYLNIPAQADHDPAKGQTDILGREPGQYMISARDDADDAWWEARKREVGSRQWAAIYQGRPSPGEGTILKREWWRYYDQPLWVVTQSGTREVVGVDAELIITVDCAFKAHQEADYVCMDVWMRRGVHMYLLDQVHRRMDFTETCNALLNLSALWPQATLKVVEEAANGPAVMAQLRNQLPGIVGEIPQGSKEARAYATTPYLEAGNIYLPSPSLAPWAAEAVEEYAIFPNGANDDRVDTYTMAVNRLLIQPLEGEVPDSRTEEEMWADLRGFSISPY